MTGIRHYFAMRRVLAAWIVAAALLMKLVVPNGFMPVISGGTMTIQLCSGFGPETMTMAMPGMDDHGGKTHQPDKGETPCGFAGHAPPSMAAADPVLLIAALVFIVETTSRLPVSRPEGRVAFLRPQPRGPPAIR